MKSNSLYIASHERKTGGLIVSLGLLSMLRQKYGKIAYFIPVYEDSYIEDFEFINHTFQLELEFSQMSGVHIEKMTQAITQNNTHQLYESLVSQFQGLLKEFNFVVVQGVEYREHHTSIDFDINVELAKHFNSPYVSIINGKKKSLAQIQQDIEIESINSRSLEPFGYFVNRVDKNIDFKNLARNSQLPLFFIPEEESLNLPTIQEICTALEGKFINPEHGSYNRLVKTPIVAAMTPENYLQRLEEKDLVIVPGDRTDIILASIMSMTDRSIPNIAGLVLTGDIMPKPVIQSLIESFNQNLLPIILVKTDTYQSTVIASKVEAKFSIENKQKTSLALGLFDRYVDQACLLEKLHQHQQTHDIMTPTMFEFNLFAKARQKQTRIVFPEAQDERVLKACEILHNRQILNPVLLGNPSEIRFQASLIGVDLTGIEIINPETSVWREQFIEEFYAMRAHKGLKLNVAKDSMTHVNYFATMMVQTGKVDGMVSGAVHTTADTVRPALQIIKAKASNQLVSSVFFMCFDTRVLVFGDCAVNQKPNAEQLADIALTSAATASSFGIEPKVALLSYSSDQSGSGEEVDKVTQAAKIAQARKPKLQPELLIEGPIQYDAAIDSNVACKKLPNSLVAGQATVFIFPDLNTGNNTYKAVERTSKAIAIGPILQGLNKPINDLSRGCNVNDIVNTAAITAIQVHTK